MLRRRLQARAVAGSIIRAGRCRGEAGLAARWARHRLACPAACMQVKTWETCMRGGMEQSNERHRPPSLLSTPHTAHQPASRALPTSLLDVHPQWICLPFFLAGCPLIQKCLELGTGRGGCRGGGRACAHPHGHGRGMRPPDDPRPRYAGRGPSPRQAPCRITASPLATVFTASGHASKPCLLSLRTHSPPFPLPPLPHSHTPFGPTLVCRRCIAALPRPDCPRIRSRCSTSAFFVSCLQA